MQMAQMQQEALGAAKLMQPADPPLPIGHVFRGVDTRTLGRPAHFDGREKNWTDWATALRAYAGLVNPSLVNCSMTLKVKT